MPNKIRDIISTFYELARLVIMLVGIYALLVFVTTMRSVDNTAQDVSSFLESVQIEYNTNP